MNKPHFSVITITKNNLDGLRRTDQSLIMQSYQDFEWIVIDGGSTDGTLDHFSPVISEPDQGIYDAMNKGLQRAAGEYVLFLNAGDALTRPNALALASLCRADFIYADAMEDGHLKTAKAHHCIQTGMITHTPCMIFKRSVVRGMMFDTRYDIAADYAFVWQLLNTGVTAQYLSYALSHFESGGLSQRKHALGRREQFAIRQKMGIPLIPSLALYQKQLAAQMIKDLLPPLFWRVKSRRNIAPWPWRNQIRPAHPQSPAAQHSHTRTISSRAAA